MTMAVLRIEKQGNSMLPQLDHDEQQAMETVTLS